ncbi:MAG: hypothetical protein ACWA5A_04490 [Marinibacterium sp.]
MSDDQQPPETPGPKAQSAAEQIEELFRLADMASARSKASNLEEARQRERARERLARILDRETAPGDSDPEVSHEWVLDVLSDLAAYANRHNLVELEETLRVTQFAAILLLRGQEDD